ncbi:MAG: ABC transporter substrate binding protein, partial [Casimicrobiaceae bacterium]
MTHRRKLLCFVVGGLVAAAVGARAQQARKIPVVGFLTSGTGDTWSVFRTTMRELGYLEGTSLMVELRSSRGNDATLPLLASELVRLNVDVLYAIGPAAVRAAKDATSAIPIVALDLETDPVASGMVRSLGRPGGNLTGLFLDQPEIAGKWLQLLSEAAPGRRRVGLLWDSATGTGQMIAAKAAAQRIGTELRILEIRRGDDLDRV